jgi:hypothetical protein
MLFKTPSGYVQQSPWLGIINKQLELMGVSVWSDRYRVQRHGRSSSTFVIL